MSESEDKKDPTKKSDTDPGVDSEKTASDDSSDDSKKEEKKEPAEIA